MKNLDGHSETRNGHRKTAERPKAEPYSSKKSILSNDSIMNGLKVEETTSDPGLDSGKNPSQFHTNHLSFQSTKLIHFRFILWNLL